MKQLFRSNPTGKLNPAQVLPAQLATELEDVRFVKLADGPFPSVLAKGDDPNVVNDSVDGGVLYRIDEPEA